MGNSSIKAKVSQPPGAGNDHLESWKEIAAHLKRDIRTVQRWEKAEALPVHRHMHSERGTVYAHRVELDAWWSNRRPRLEKQEGSRAGLSRRWWIAAAGALALGLAAVIGAKLTRRPGLPFRGQDWVLIANFENRTGEPVFDGTIEYALARDLSNSQFANVVPRPRVIDTLRLMKKPDNMRLDEALGREICLRDGGIRALLTGRVEKLDSTYVMSVEVVNPADGVSVANLSEEAAGQHELLPALHRLSNRLREVLGEKLSAIHESDEKLEKVTTPSLRALQLHSRGMWLIENDEWEEGTTFFEQAVAEDPEFASAHIYLAHCYSNFGRNKEAGPHYQRAFELAGTTTDRERYFILGSYFDGFARDKEKAIQAYEMLVRLYPDDYWGTNNLAYLYQASGNTQKVVSMLARAAQLRPNDFRMNAEVAKRLLTSGYASIQQVAPYMHRALAMVSPETHHGDPDRAVDVELFPATEFWDDGNPSRVISELNRLGLMANSAAGEYRDDLAAHLSDSYLVLGRVKQSEESLRSISGPETRGYHLAVADLATDDQHALHKHASGLGGEVLWGTPVPAILVARAGLLREAHQAVLVGEKIFGRGSGWYETMQGELDMAQGQPSRALPLLQQAIRSIPPSSITFYLGSESLARAWELQGNLTKAIEVLEQASRKRSFVRVDIAGWAWMRDEWRLAQLYHKTGREQDAQEVEANLLKLLAYADADFPLLVQLKRLQQAGSASSQN